MSGRTFELRLVVEQAPEGGFIAPPEASIYTQADDWPSLCEAVREAVQRAFDEPALRP